jgi:hypothetical protein
MREILEQNILAIKQLQVGMDAAQLGEFLRTRHITLVLTDVNPSHLVALRTAINLLSRLSFEVSVTATVHAPGEAFVTQAVAEARQFSFDRVHQKNDHIQDLTIAVGNGPYEGAGMRAYASGWNIYVTYGRVGGKGTQTSNALCGAMLGVLITSEAFNLTIGPVLGKNGAQREVIISLLDYSSTLSAKPAELPEVTIPHATLIGCGAVGNAFVYALSLIPDLSGRLDVVDPDWFTKTNVHRYMLARVVDVKTERIYKTQRAKEVLRHHSQLELVGYEKNFDDFLKEDCEERRIPFLISAVDSSGKRRDLGRETPLEAINASTGHFTLAVSTHYEAYKLDGPCVGCHYPPRDAEQERFALIARETGLPVDQVQELSNANARVTSKLLARVATFRSIPVQDYAEYEGQPFDSFYQHGVCGGTEVQTSSGKVEIPLAHVSAAAGILLACELVKRFTPSLAKYSLNNFLQLDMLNLTSEWFLQRKAAREECDCRRGIYQRRFTSKYQDVGRT